MSGVWKSFLLSYVLLNNTVYNRSSWTKKHKVSKPGQTKFWGEERWCGYVGFTHIQDLWIPARAGRKVYQPIN